MPEMDGYEATGHIRNPKSAVLNHSIPIIAMTGDRKKCIDAGMNDYISKPVEPLALVDKIEKWTSDPSHQSLLRRPRTRRRRTLSLTRALSAQSGDG